MLNLRKKILVAIDGSPLSDKAAEEAVRMAAGNPSQFKSKIYAVLVLPNAPRNTFTDFVPNKPITETQQWDEMKERIFYVVRKNAAEANIPLEMKVIYGDPAEELIKFAVPGVLEYLAAFRTLLQGYGPGDAVVGPGGAPSPVRSAGCHRPLPPFHSVPWQ